ncbi:uncharacterized protein BXZ73DRAFT_107329 [Epithele typhae]|uniref:uncharacterized protein n=1 Tax=Epithele typhae TaxID=378194 RepID=UPI002007A3CD|nr:uncharacterized protein BXZ73DRAFT_107329 [Epithele typhae]KAH9912694.1 hypothetical protein BXZ73DRAFT_107329 [Epithele typhae]
MFTSLATSSTPRAVLVAPALLYLLSLGFIAALSLVAAHPPFIQLILVVVLGHIFGVQLHVVQCSSTPAKTQTTLAVELSFSVPSFADLAPSSFLPRAFDASRAAVKAFRDVVIEALSFAVIAVYVLAQVAKTAAMYAAVFGLCALFGVATAAHGTFVAVVLIADALARPVDASDDAIAVCTPRQVAADIAVVAIESSKVFNTVLAITANAETDDNSDDVEDTAESSGDDEDDTESTVDEALLTPADSIHEFEVEIREDALNVEEDTLDESDIYGGLLKLVEAAAASDPSCANDNDVAELLLAMDSLALSAPCTFDSLPDSPAEACPTDDVDAFFQLTEQLAEATPLVIKIGPADNEDVDMAILLASLTFSGDHSPSPLEGPWAALDMNVDECENPAMDIEIPCTMDAEPTSTSSVDSGNINDESLAVDCLMTDEEIEYFALELDTILQADAEESSPSVPDDSMSLDDQDAVMALLSLATSTPPSLRSSSSDSPIPLHVPTSEELDAVFQQALTNCAAVGVSPHDVKVELSDEDYELFERACVPVDPTFDSPLNGLFSLADAAVTVAPMDVKSESRAKPSFSDDDAAQLLLAFSSPSSSSTAFFPPPVVAQSEPKSESTPELFRENDAAQLLLVLGANVPPPSDFFAPPAAASSEDLGVSSDAAVTELHMRIVTRPMKALPRSRTLRRSARLGGSAKLL